MVLSLGGSTRDVRTAPVPQTGGPLIFDLAFPVSIVAAMTTFQTKKDPLLRGVSPTPSKIPVSSKRRPPVPTVKPCTLDQENQDPKRLEQKFSIQHPLVDSAGPRPKATHQTEKPERLVGSTLLRNPLEELRPSPRGQNVGPGPPPQTEIPGATEFVADPEALATILSGEGVKSCRLGRQPSLAQRVLIRGSQGGTIRRGQIPPLRPSFCPSTRPSFQELKRETGGSSSRLLAAALIVIRTSVIQTSGLLLETPVQPASSLLKGERKVVTHSDEGGRGPVSLAQWVPLGQTRELTHMKDNRDCHLMPSSGHLLLPSNPHPSPFGLAQRVPSPASSALTSYSVLRRLAIRPKTQFTPIPSAPRTQQARCLSGLSPQSCSEEPALPWEQIAVRLFDQESCKRLQEGPGKPPVATLHRPHPSRTPNLQELKMQRISILQQLLQQEVEGLAESKCAPINGGTLNAPEHNSGAFHLPELSQHSGLPKPCFPEECGEPQLCPGAEPEVAQPCPTAEQVPPESCCRREPEIPEPTTQNQPEVSEACPPVEPGPFQACSQGQTGLPEPSARVEPGASKACSLEPRSTESSPQPFCCQRAPATTSVIFSSQRPLCASPPIHSLQSLRPPTGQAGPSSLAPRTLALRQRLKACLTAIHCFHEACLDDECAFYTSRAPPSGPSRVCTNPVAMFLEWQDALCFIPIGSAAAPDSPT
ncbi:tastin isoform X5 [Molossus molossus]|uniref:tastin isoform X5 n=1 Tax=Molossus molossus TaxID=27622 RepID=UPI001746BE9A|nr:tastin isoform X5 [Molossus molossus]